MYESEITKFLRQLQQEDPQLPEKQREARAIWWDKRYDLDQTKRDRESKVPQPAYVYFESGK